MRRFMTTILATALFVGVLAAPASASHRSEPTQTITEIVVAASGGAGEIGNYDSNGRDYDVLREAVIALDLADALNGGEWTVFAPNDAAFEMLTGTDESDVISTLLSPAFFDGDLDAVKNVVLYHVIADDAKSRYEVFYTKFWRTKTFEMANGDDLDVRWFRLIDGTDNKIRPVWNATNIKATNGYIHTISEVLLP
jgi:uncharacterized surface protein with fasciclin (FAS1) repeats